MSLTTEKFGQPPEGPGYYWVYYTITKPREFVTAMTASRTNPVVLMFWDKRNEPCKVMKIPFWEMAMAKTNEAVFCRVDVEKCKDIAELYRVEALPTFLLIKERNEKGRVVGAKVEELNNTIKANINTNIPI